MYKNLFDCHIHSEHSFDSKLPVKEICLQAEKLGLRGLAITDHSEGQGLRDREWDFPSHIADSVKNTRFAQQEFEGRLKVICGFEIAQVLQDYDLANQIVDGNSFDFIIGSLHGIGRTKETFEYWVHTEPVDIDRKIEDYYNQIMEMTRWGKFDVLGHLTYPIRYVTAKHKIPLDFARYSDLMDQVLRLLIETGHGIEINTSGLRQGVDLPMPHLPWVKRYRELGGEIVTIGSDAHFIEHVGADVAPCMDMMKEAGFRYFTYYIDRKPHFELLD